jgi:hypothetical protein
MTSRKIPRYDLRSGNVTQPRTSTLLQGAFPQLLNRTINCRFAVQFSNIISELVNLMFTGIAAPVTLDSFLRISFRTTSRPSHLRFLTTTPSCARRPGMSHNESGSDANVQRPKKLICTFDTPTRSRCDTHTHTHTSWQRTPPRGTSHHATQLQSNKLTPIPPHSRPRRYRSWSRVPESRDSPDANSCSDPISSRAGRSPPLRNLDTQFHDRKPDSVQRGASTPICD